VHGWMAMLQRDLSCVKALNRVSIDVAVEVMTRDVGNEEV
jgi:hypothetical protein